MSGRTDLWVAERDGDLSRRRGVVRRLILRHGGDTFLDRRGVECQLFGVYLHRITAADPGIDLHDHPWPFVSVVLWGGYWEERADARMASRFAGFAEINEAHQAWKDVPGSAPRGHVGERRRWSVRRFRMDEAHRITEVRPRTWTLVVRGRKSRPWGFFQPDGWVDQRRYDYATRRPVTGEHHEGGQVRLDGMRGRS